MRLKIKLWMPLVLLGIAACDTDTGDPHGDGADVVETPESPPTQPARTEKPSETPAMPSEQPTRPAGRPSEAPPVPTDQPTEGPAEPTEEAREDPEESGSESAGTYTDPLSAGTTFVLSDRIDGEGEPVELWEVAVGPTDTDATDEVLAENEFNEIAEGRRAVMTEVTATYVGPETGQAWIDLNFVYLGSDGNTFAFGDNDYCGVIPNDLTNHGEQFPRAMVTGNVCQAVPEDVIEGGMWIVALAFTWDDHRVFVRTD
jgi:hypothetical protein